jgi:hypothetical protein
VLLARTLKATLHYLARLSRVGNVRFGLGELVFRSKTHLTRKPDLT